MLKLEGNQPKEHNNSNTKTPSIFPFPLNFLIWRYITGTQITVNAVMLKVVVIFLYLFFNPESWRLFCSSHTKEEL